MTRPSKVFLGLVILGAILVAVAWLMATRPSIKYSLAKPQSYAQCLDAGGAILESYPSQCSFHGQTFTNPDEHQDATPPAQTGAEPANELKTYTDVANKMSFQYPTAIFTEGRTPIKLPWKNKSIDSLILRHTIPVQHCGLSGLPEHCTDTTTDISIAFTPLEASLADVVASAKIVMGPFVDVTLGGLPATTATQGVEGEGNIYHFFELGPERSLMITQSYIDDTVVGGYKDQPGFINVGRQQEIFNELMATFSLNK
jgi:hypothetical protein